MKKEKAKDRTEAREVKIRYEPGKMIFETDGGGVFYITEEVAGGLFSRPVQLAFERAHSQDPDFGGLRTLKNFVLVRRLLGKGLGLPQIARVLGAPEERVRQFYAFETARPHVESWNINEVENERERQAAAEMDFVKETRRDRALNEVEPPEPGEKFVDLLQLRNLQKEEMSEDRMADYLGLDRKEFSKFLEKNQRYLNLLP